MMCYHLNVQFQGQRVKIVRQLEQVFELYRIMFKEANEGKDSSAHHNDSAKKRKTVKTIRNCLTVEGGRKIIHRFLLFGQVGLGT